MGKARDRTCAASGTLTVIMVHDLSLTLNVQKRNIKETPGNDSRILLFIISVFINFSCVLAGNIHHFLYLSSIYPCCQCLLRDLNGRHVSEWVIVGMRSIDRIRKFGYFLTTDMVQHDCVYQINMNTNALAFKTVQYFSLLSIIKLVVETYILQ